MEVDVVVVTSVVVVVVVVMEVVVAVAVTVTEGVATTLTVVGVRKLLQKVLAWAATASRQAGPLAASLRWQRPERKARALDRQVASQVEVGAGRVVAVVRPTRATTVVRREWWSMLPVGGKMNE